VVCNKASFTIAQSIRVAKLGNYSSFNASRYVSQKKKEENMEIKKNNTDILNNERGQGMAEYIIIVILVAIIVLVGVRLFGKSVINQFNNATEEVDTLK
jgi:Flp pilus assembly pilin Flp